MVSATRIRRFEPKLEWFAHRPGGIHGIVHEARVLIWSQVLAGVAADEGIHVDSDVLGWAAVVHDTQRQSDGIDPEHGSRAAGWIERRRELIPPFGAAGKGRVPVPVACSTGRRGTGHDRRAAGLQGCGRARPLAYL